MVAGDTIAAIATAPGLSGVAIVRVSGPDAFAIAAHLTGELAGAYSGDAASCRVKKLFSISDAAGRRVPEVRRVPEAPDAHQVLDTCVVLSFKGPHSYTGEDVVEFQCHGGTVTPRRILEACFAAGARLARRGEFTERAFLNGKLDYDQAESVLDLIHARTDRAADAALEGLAGRRRRELRRLYDAALAISAEFEHSLDVDESDLTSDFFSALGAKIAALLADLRGEIARIRRGRIMRDGALVVLAGPPNAGKSSLMNALLDENRAIVSDVPGTTRDSIEAWLDVEGIPVRLVDTAGLREVEKACRRGTAERSETAEGGSPRPEDQATIETEGIRRSQELIAAADIVLSLDGNAIAPLRVETILIHSKCDLGRGEGLNVSAKTGEGLAELKAELVRRIAALEPKGDDSNLDSLIETEARLAAVVGETDPVLAANGVRAAAQTLGAVLGATYSADLLDRLFSRFCVGK